MSIPQSSPANYEQGQGNRMFKKMALWESPRQPEDMGVLVGRFAALESEYDSAVKIYGD
jgi:hypothetical protein